MIVCDASFLETCIRVSKGFPVPSRHRFRWEGVNNVKKRHFNDHAYNEVFVK